MYVESAAIRTDYHHAIANKLSEAYMMFCSKIVPGTSATAG